jgi:predicted DCC family thiol-disulfide oxidoreductase YuxK
MTRPAPLLLAYDGECPLCRRMVDRVQRWDGWGLVVVFPLQNAELLHMAPELAGRPLDLEMHAVDTGNRRVFAGAEILPQILRRLPRWCLVAPLMSLPGASTLARRFYLRFTAGRHHTSGRTPLR